jgi:hypothetical protein
VAVGVAWAPNMRAPFALLFTAALLAAVSAAHAAPADDAMKSTARRIAKEGLDLYDSGKYKDALDRFVRADQLVHAPTMGLMAARSLAKLGRLVEASERYLTVSQTPLEADASSAFREAIASAASEREALQPRLASVFITVELPADAAGTASVTIDGTAVPAAMIGLKRPTDPGPHTLEATYKDVLKTLSIDLKEGESSPAHFDLRSTAVAPVPSSSSPLRPVGWLTVGLGVAGLSLGAVTGGLAFAKKGELDTKWKCVDNFCPTHAADADVNALNTMRTLSTAGFVAGGLALAGGITLLILAPKPTATSARALWSPRIGFGTVGLQGAF